ncbi:hypothetical protein [uncultured Phenylobacterium sp.]|uniref:hypothetical protein n=1 Tax=uncultured Phenylobacterium sp. TaxID=349273 RepID=UPI0025E30D86|nr:hypothetical protein [uncultured Phenylobacterium sp.]
MIGVMILRLFGLGRPAGPPRWTGPPDATPIHAWLDAAGFPWRASRAELARRYGVAPDPAYGGDYVKVPTEPPLLPGLFRPLAAHWRDEISTRLPAIEFHGALNVGGDARANLKAAAAQLAPMFGRERIAPINNTIEAEWRFGPASVRLTAWPRDLQGPYEAAIDAETRDPRLEGACHLRVNTGFSPPLSAQEREWVNTFVPLFEDAPRFTPQQIRDSAASELLLEFARPLPPSADVLNGRLGRSADGAGLVLCVGYLFVAPMADVVRLELERVRPGRGGGWEALSLAIRSGDQIKALHVASGMYQSALEADARDLARRLDRPFALIDGGDDT